MSRRGAELTHPTRTGSAPFTPTHIRKRALDAWEAVNVKRRDEKQPELVPIALHECRHTFVSLMHAAGRTLEEIGDYAGHSSTYMTDRYRHLIEGARTEAADALDAYLTQGVAR